MPQCIMWVIPQRDVTMFRVELRYLSGWGDAGWIEANGDGERPLRFGDLFVARRVLAQFFAEVKSAVREGNMDIEEAADDYRIAETDD